MTKHTPGPWVWNYKESLHQVGDGKPYNYGPIVAYASSEYETGTNIIVSDADACLIAAAPDLLHALKVLLAVDCGIWNVERHAREKAEAKDAACAAIARATGAA